MAEYISVHTENPQPRILKQIVNALQQGAVIAYPTDSTYALGCRLDDKMALSRIKKIRQLSDKHLFTLICRNISEVAKYTDLSNAVFRLLKTNTPGAFTFILPTTAHVPRRLLSKRKVIGMRIPDNTITQALLQILDEPLMSTTLQLPNSDLPFAAPEDIYMALDSQLDIIIDGGHCGIGLTTVVDLTTEVVQVIRQGKANIAY